MSAGKLSIVVSGGNSTFGNVSHGDGNTNVGELQIVDSGNEQAFLGSGRLTMNESTSHGQSGGVNISGTIGTVAGDIVGRDKTVAGPSAAALDDALRPVHDAIKAAPSKVQLEAEAKLAALKHEAAKGKDANDGVMAKLVDGLVELVPPAASAVGSAFGTPILGTLVGPVTNFVIDKLRAK